mgnify:CR=1 FL=1
MTTKKDRTDDRRPLFPEHGAIGQTHVIGRLGEAIAGGRAADMEDEFGDLLFALVNIGRHLDIDAERESVADLLGDDVMRRQMTPRQLEPSGAANTSSESVAEAGRVFFLTM